jgi:hypothetical protein
MKTTNYQALKVIKLIINAKNAHHLLISAIISVG